jgi:hypothetical protein
MTPGDRHVTVLAWRADGWPLCPSCGDDDLYSLELPATARTICGCYRCGPLTLRNPSPPNPAQETFDAAERVVQHTAIARARGLLK